MTHAGKLQLSVISFGVVAKPRVVATRDMMSCHKEGLAESHPVD